MGAQVGIPVRQNNNVDAGNITPAVSQTAFDNALAASTVASASSAAGTLTFSVSNKAYSVANQGGQLILRSGTQIIRGIQALQVLGSALAQGLLSSGALSRAGIGLGTFAAVWQWGVDSNANLAKTALASQEAAAAFLRENPSLKAVRGGIGAGTNADIGITRIRDAGDNYTIMLWDAASGTFRKNPNLQADGSLKLHDGTVYKPDGTVVRPPRTPSVPVPLVTTPVPEVKLPAKKISPIIPKPLDIIKSIKSKYASEPPIFREYLEKILLKFAEDNAPNNSTGQSKALMYLLTKKGNLYLKSFCKYSLTC